jgi:hypothetical protein
VDSFKLFIPRLLGVLGEPNPPFGHFDGKDLCAELRASSANRMRSAAFLRNWSKLGERAAISFCSTLGAV